MLQPRVIHDLCRFPMWWIDELSFTQDKSIVIDGWALAVNSDLMIGEIAMDGRKPDVFQRGPSPALPSLFRWHENTETARYRAVFHGVDPTASEILRFSYRGRWTLDPFNRWQDIYFPLRAWLAHSFVEPDGPQMTRTQGSANFLRYVMYGTTAASMLNEVTQTYFGKSLADLSDICDWGCGCGRVAQAVHRVAPKASITGLDIDRENIEWCQQNLPYARFAEVPLFPPSAIADCQFDLLYGISVFTHLTREAFEAWRDEVYRIVRPGGLVLVTINRGAALARVANEGLVHRTHASGFDDLSLDNALDGKIGDGTYYRGTYLTTYEAKHIFGTRFRIRDILPQASGTSQDLVVCEKLPAAAIGRPTADA